MCSAKNDNSELGYFLQCISFQSFGRILGHHDENCMKKAKELSCQKFPRIPSYRYGRSFYLRSTTSHVYLCLILTFSSFRKIQIFLLILSAINSMWLQSRELLTVSCNWFISQNPDFINVINNVDFAKSSSFFISQNPVSQLEQM